jgi:threonine dehydrogenase-like Zn-dependent dehydrogenase
MRATYIYGAGDIRVINVPDPVIQQPTDAIVRVVRACICGSEDVCHAEHFLHDCSARG